jgi:uncharacterized membrane protein YesL
MNHLFNLDNPFFTAMGKVADLFILNMVFLLCCIPVITIGPALSALFYVTLKMVRNEESYIVRSFFHSFRQNLKQGILIHLIMLLVGCILLADYRIIGQMDGSFTNVIRIIIMAMTVLYALVFLYIYPVLAKFYNTIKNTFRNAVLMAIRHLPLTILMLIISICPLAVLLIPTASVQSTIILLLILVGPAAIAYANSFFFVKIFDKYVPAEETEAQENSPEADAIENGANPESCLTAQSDIKEV